ncbi:MAG: hypothetical protein U0Y08_13010 [Bacteroidia bacterium]
MDLTHLHLLLNHFPIIGTIAGIGIMLWGLLKKDSNVQRAVLGLWVVLTLITLPVMKTGEEAEETIEKIPGISEQVMHEHEEAAEFALWWMIALGAVSLVGLILGRKELNKKLVYAAFAVSLMTFAVMARTGYLGGQIRHTEIYGKAAVTDAPGQNGAAAAEEDED